MYYPNSVDYFEDFDRSVSISESESVFFKRNPDNIVEVSHFDALTGTLTKLAYYQYGKWTGYNYPNFNKLFILFKNYKKLKPSLIRFLTPNDKPQDIKKMERVFVCFKKRFHITVMKTKRNINKDLFNRLNKTFLD